MTERLGRSVAQTAPDERIVAALIPAASAALQHLQDRTGLSKTDLTNRAITLYEFIDAQIQAGHELIVRNNITGEASLMRLL
jgi:hypothetical protein